MGNSFFFHLVNQVEGEIFFLFRTEPFTVLAFEFIFLLLNISHRFSKLYLKFFSMFILSDRNH